MKRKFTVLLVVLAAALPGLAQSVTLESVLASMDKAAGEFKNAQADLQQEQFTRVVNETDTQKGTVYFQRAKGGLEMMVVFKQPQEKFVLYSGNSLQVYQPSIEQVNKYDLSKHKQEVDSFLTLGFGGRGKDLSKSFDVKLASPSETVGGVKAAKLELVPKNPQARNTASKICLWIDTARGVSVQQQFFEPSGDYRLAKYSNIKINENLPGDTFKLKTTGKTKIVTP